MKQGIDKTQNSLRPLKLLLPIAIVAILGVTIWTSISISQQPLLGVYDNLAVGSVIGYTLGYSLLPIIIATIVLFRLRKKAHVAVKVVVILSIILYSLIFSIGSIHTDQYAMEQDYIIENQ